MATVEKRSDNYRITFYYESRRYRFNMGAVSEPLAEGKAAKVEEVLALLKSGYLTIPEGMDLVEFVRHDGKPPENVPPKPGVQDPSCLTLGQLRDKYLAVHTGKLEESTLKGVKQHFRHWVKTLPESFPIQTLRLPHLQQHVDRRSKEGVSPATCEKEIVSLRTVWNWGVRFDLLTGAFPNRGLVYPKHDEKPPFMTYDEIVRRGGTEWSSLYLQSHEIAELLEHVKAKAQHPWIYPMFVFIAHTGCRRSEMLRAQVNDIDFEAGVITIHEKKRARGRNTTRRVPMSKLLVETMREYLAIHPGGPHLFCTWGEVERSPKRSKTTGHKDQKTRPSGQKARAALVNLRQAVDVLPLTKDEAHGHLKRTLKGSKWEVIPAFHAFRHSVASGLASKGVSDRIIDDILGHSSEEQRRRYRHITPVSKHDAMGELFD